MKICHIVDLKNVGGVETLFSKFLSFDFGTLDINHTVIFNSVIHPFFREDVMSNVSDAMSIKFGKHLKVRTAQLKALRVRRFYRKNCPDIIIFWNNFPSSFTQCIPPSAKVIYYEHGNSAFEHDAKKVDEFLTRVTRVVAVSKGIEKLFELKFTAKQLNKQVIYNFIDDWYVEMEPVISTLNGGYRIGMAGRVVPGKGMAIVVKAVAILKNRGIEVSLDVAGDGDERCHLLELAVREGVSDQLTFHTGLRDLREFYAGLDLLLVPSITEAASLVVAESLACGTPVVANRTGGIPEIGKEGEGTTLIEPTMALAEYAQWCSSSDGLSEYSIESTDDSMGPTKVLDPERVADAMLQVLHNKAEYAEQASRGARYAKEKFSKKRYIEHFATLLAGTVESDGQR
ncbi:N-acetyl-alpha-D-glucosaminyl L-malate synthase [Halioglobus japonicus]|nr:N-acetyl-alpha-D-glucosaminyl L-malate synthase [Halioglobus japonicus]